MIWMNFIHHYNFADLLRLFSINVQISPRLSPGLQTIVHISTCQIILNITIFSKSSTSFQKTKFLKTSGEIRVDEQTDATVHFSCWYSISYHNTRFSSIKYHLCIIRVRLQLSMICTEIKNINLKLITANICLVKLTKNS